MRKLWTLAGIGVLSMTLGVPALTWAQEDEKPKQEEAKPEPKAAEPSADPKQDEMKPPKQDDMKPAKQQDDMKPPKDDAKPSKADKQQTEPAAQPQEHPGKNMAQPANGNGGHIPDDKFKSHFGRSHTVVIRQPVMVGGQPRFQFGGYWFVISDPWPAGWLYTDDCYIDYVDGEYVLIDLAHPGVQIALVVVM
jgi:hypothetical protein